MDPHIVRTRLRTEIQAFVRLYQAMGGTAIGLASVSLDGLDQSWRDRVQRIRALPREAPRRKHMIDALIKLIEQTLWKQYANIEKLQEIDPALTTEALSIARRGGVINETPSQDA
jgi:dihydroxyacetone kinase